MAIDTIALVGATGNLGAAVLKALLDTNFHVTNLTRTDATSTDSLSSHPKQVIKRVDFSDVNSVANAIQGLQGLVSTVASHVLDTQKVMIDAAIAAGIQRFLPSEFGSDLSVPAAEEVEFNAPKVAIADYLHQKVENHPGFTYTSIYCGPFQDWCLKHSVFGDLKNRSMMIWDGADTRFSTTTLLFWWQGCCGHFS